MMDWMDWQKEQLKVATGVTDGSPKHYQDEGMCQACEWGQCTAKAGCVAISNPPPKQEQGEPVAIHQYSFKELGKKAPWYDGTQDQTKWPQHVYNHRIVYTTPQQRTWVGLTLDERMELAQDVDWAAGAYCEYAEAIEAKLKEKNT